MDDIKDAKTSEAVWDDLEEAISNAEEIPNPLLDLAERTIENPGAPFEQETMDAIVALKKSDRAAFETLRKSLKDAGCRMTGFDEALKESGGGSAPEPTQADILIDLAAEADLFHSDNGTAFADIEIDGHRETWPVRVKGFKRWLSRQFFEATGGAPNSEALNSALNVIEAKAHFDGPERPVFIRVGGIDKKIYLDLGDDDWRAVEISAAGWQIINEPLVRFRRSSGMQPLPDPAQGGSVDALRSYLNVKTEADFTLIVAWLLAALRDRGPFPIIVLSGEQGSAKSTFSAILRALLDPNTAPLRALPREDRDLFIAANNGHVLAFDNVSGLPNWISDTLCRLTTGGGFAVRQLYTDQDEVLFDAARPIVLNGIEDIVTRPDLADRAIFLTLEAIPEEKRRPEAELWGEFEAERPKILGVLLDAVVTGLKMLPDTRLERLPRMADFALWASACESAIWPAGTFWAAYNGNRDDAVENVIEADPVAAAVRAMMAQRTEWTGTASDLLTELSETTGERIAKSKAWPASPRALSGRLRRAATFLRKIGIEVDSFKEGRSRNRVIVITVIEVSGHPDHKGDFASATGFASAETPNVNESNPFSYTHMRTQNGGADANADAADGADGADANLPYKSKPEEKGSAADGADGADAKSHTQSKPERSGNAGWRGTL